MASIFVSRWDVAVKDRVPGPLQNRLGIAIAARTYAAARIVKSPVFGANDADIVALSADPERDDSTAFARRAFTEAVRDDVRPGGRASVRRLRETLDALEQFAGPSHTAALQAIQLGRAAGA